MFLFFASEIAACIGKNKYVPRHEAIMKAWKRNDPDSFYEAIRRAKKTDLQDVGDIVDRLEVRPSLEEIVQDQTADISKSIQEVVQSLQLDDESKEAKAIRSFVYTERGKLREDSALDDTAKKTQMPIAQRNTRFYRKTVYYPGKMGRMDVEKQCAIGGKVDGVTNDGQRIVEIKNRQFRLFPSIPVHEYIQAQAYMFLTGVKELLHVQCLHVPSADGSFMEKEMQEELVKYDRKHWNKEIEPLIEEAAALLDKLVQDADFGCRWLQVRHEEVEEALEVGMDKEETKNDKKDAVRSYECKEETKETKEPQEVDPRGVETATHDSKSGNGETSFVPIGAIGQVAADGHGKGK